MESRLRSHILVTGGLGFIGSSFVARLLAKGDTKVTIIDRRPFDRAIKQNPLISAWADKVTYSRHQHNSGSPILLVSEELDGLDVLSHLEGVSSVVHLAANTGVQPSIHDPIMDFKQNVSVTFALLEALRAVNNPIKIVYASSVAPLAGNETFPLNNTLPLVPLSPYGASKASCESYLHAYKSSYSISSTIVRFSNVFGPGSLGKGSVVAKMIKDSLSHGSITINGDGTQVRDFVHVDDVSAVLKWAVDKNTSSSPIHVCTGVPTTINHVAERIANLIHKKVGTNVKIRRSQPLAGDAAINYSSADYLSQIGAPMPRRLSDKLLDETVEFFLAHYSE